MTSFKHLGAVLDACFVDRFHVCSGSLDKIIRQYVPSHRVSSRLIAPHLMAEVLMARVLDRFELSSSSESKIGEHEQAVRCTEYSDSINALISGSWDATLKVWDLRANSCTSTHSLGNKVRRCTSARKRERARARDIARDIAPYQSWR